MASGGWSAQHPHLFHFGAWPIDEFAGGTLKGATEQNWKILTGKGASVYLARLAPGGVREPHWHPNAWELNFVLSGRGRWRLVGPHAEADAFEVGKGDLVFAPQGHFHYFENASESEDFEVLIIFNASAAEADDDIGITASLGAIPHDVLAAVLGVDPAKLDALPHKIDRVTIASKRPKAD